MRNDHVALRVSDMDASIAFYTRALGLRLLSRSMNPAEREEYAFLELEGGNLELIQRLAGEPFIPPAIQPPYCPHLALATDDMAGTVASLQAAQIPIVRGPLEIAGEETWVYIADPDHNVIEFIRWLRPH